MTILLAFGLTSLYFFINRDANEQLPKISQINKQDSNITEPHFKGTSHSTLVNMSPEWGDHVDEISAWQQKEFGYYLTNVIMSDYDSYNIETLKSLAAQGDLKALDLLAWKYLKLKDIGKAIYYYNKAAILGSTYALKVLGKISDTARAKDKTQTQTDAITELAYYQAGILRGDTSLLLESESCIEVRGLALSDEDKLFIQNMGAKIYADLKSERVALGLGKFNSMPQTVRDFYFYVAQGNLELTTGASPLFVLNKY